MDLKTVCDTLRPLFELSHEVMETNAPYQWLLAERVLQAGKPLEQMTLTEVRQLVDTATADYLTASQPKETQ